MLCRSVERPWHKTIVVSAVALEKAVTAEAVTVEVVEEVHEVVRATVLEEVRVTVAATLVVARSVTVRVAVLPMVQVRAEAGLASVAKAT